MKTEIASQVETPPSGRIRERLKQCGAQLICVRIIAPLFENTVGQSRHREPRISVIHVLGGGGHNVVGVIVCLLAGGNVERMENPARQWASVIRRAPTLVEKRTSNVGCVLLFTRHRRDPGDVISKTLDECGLLALGKVALDMIAQKQHLLSTRCHRNVAAIRATGEADHGSFVRNQFAETIARRDSSREGS